MTEDKKKNGIQGMLKATSIMVIANLVGSVLGFGKSILINSIFGPGMETDAYNAAFKIPDFIYTILVGGGLSSAFIPIFSQYLARNEKKRGYRMANTVLNLVVVFAVGLSILGLIFTPQLTRLLVDYTGEGFDLTVRLTRIMFLQSFFMCLVGVFMGILQTYQDFAPSSIGAVFYNLCIVVFGVVLSQTLGLGIAGFSISVVIGAFVDLLCHIRPLKRAKFEYMPIIDFKEEGVKQFFRLLWPSLLGMSVNQINIMVNQKFASGLGDSTITVMGNALQIMNLPVNMFAAISLAIFPAMSQSYSIGKVDDYKENLRIGFNTTNFVAFPSMAGLIFLSKPVIRMMFLQGKTTAKDVDNIAFYLIVYSIGIVAYSLRVHLNRCFYAAQDTKTPVTVNIIVLTINIILSFVFVKFWQGGGLAAAYVVAGFVSMILNFVLLRKKIGRMGITQMVRSLVKTVISTTVMSVVLIILTKICEANLDLSGKLMQLIETVGLTFVGIIVYFVTAYLIKAEEMTTVIDIIKRKIKRH